MEDDTLSLFTGSARRAADDQTNPTSSRPTRARRRWWIVPVVVLLAAALLGGGAWLIWHPREEPEQPGVAKTPASAVQQYLDALSRGDADAALALSASQPNDTRFLTSDTLTTAMLANPLTAIEVPPGQSTTTPATIQATYQMGGKTVHAHFTVQQWTQGWLLDGGFLTLNLASLTAKGVPLTMNGVDITGLATAQLFPGVYTLASSNPMLTLTNGSFTIEYPESNPAFSQFGFALSEEAVQRIQAAAQAKLTDCLASKDLQPAGCGFGVDPTAYAVDPATVQWTLHDDSPDLTAITLALEAGSLTIATADAQVTVDFRASTADHHRRVNGTSTVASVQADFTNPDQIGILLGG